MKRAQLKSATLEHRQQAANLGTIAIAIVTVSDSRSEKADINGQYLKDQIKKLGHECCGYRVVKDEPVQVEEALEEFCQTKAQLIIFNGGTGVSRRDRTFDVISKKLEKTLPGFGELFRMLSYKEVGSAAMLSRATAGVYKNKVVISTPGSPNAVEVAWTKLIEPELQHLAWEITR